MTKIREWMHGKGRTVVIVIVCLIALWIIVDYYLDKRDKPQSKTGSPAILTQPEEDTESRRDEETDSEGETITEESTGSEGEPEDEELSTEEDTGADTTTTEEDLEDGSDITTTEEDAGVGAEASGSASGDTVTLGFAGDINLDENWTVMKHMRRRGEGISGCIDPELIRRMRQEDYMILNNEFAISDRGTPMEGKAYTFRAPAANVSILSRLGVDVVSLANNHVYDYGKNAFLDTLSGLKEGGIKYTGGGKNSREAKRPVYLKCKGRTIAVIAATRAEKYIMTPEAGKTSPGVFRTYDDTEYVRAIRKAKKRADYVIAFVHWGTEYSTKLEAAQKEQARDYIDAGADAVVGAHTHCLQGVGYYKGKPVFYSLGNFWFNEKTLYTTLLQLNILPDGKIEAQMLPCLQANRETRILKGKRRVKKFINYVNNISTNARLDAEGYVKPAGGNSGRAGD